MAALQRGRGSSSENPGAPLSNQPRPAVSPIRIQQLSLHDQQSNSVAPCWRWLTPHGFTFCLISCLLFFLISYSLLSHICYCYNFLLWLFQITLQPPSIPSSLFPSPPPLPYLAFLMPSHICFSYNISPALLFSFLLHLPLRVLEPGSSPFFPLLGSCWIMGRNCSWFIIGSIHSDAWAAKRVRGPFNPSNIPPPCLSPSLSMMQEHTGSGAAYTVCTAMKVYTGMNAVVCVCVCVCAVFYLLGWGKVVACFLACWHLLSERLSQVCIFMCLCEYTFTMY